MPTLKRNGATIAYDITGSGPSLVVIGGFSSHRNSISSRALTNIFAKRYTVLTLDNRGSGQTIQEDNTPVTIEIMADDVAALIDEHNLGPAHVLGLSMGGLIAKVLTLRHPDKVRTLVSSMSLAYTDMPRSNYLLQTWRMMLDRQVPRDLINRFAATMLLDDTVLGNEAFMNAWVQAEIDPLEQTRAGFDLQSQAMNGVDIRNQLGTIKVPTLVAGSPGDALVPFERQQEIAAGIPGAELKQYPGGHVFAVLPMVMPTYVEDLFAFWEKHNS